MFAPSCHRPIVRGCSHVGRRTIHLTCDHPPPPQHPHTTTPQSCNFIDLSSELSLSCFFAAIAVTCNICPPCLILPAALSPHSGFKASNTMLRRIISMRTSCRLGPPIVWVNDLLWSLRTRLEDSFSPRLPAVLLLRFPSSFSYAYRVILASSCIAFQP